MYAYIRRLLQVTQANAIGSWRSFSRIWLIPEFELAALAKPETLPPMGVRMAKAVEAAKDRRLGRLREELIHRAHRPHYRIGDRQPIAQDHGDPHEGSWNYSDG
jgi:hypothetical protein